MGSVIFSASSSRLASLMWHRCNLVDFFFLSPSLQHQCDPGAQQRPPSTINQLTILSCQGISARHSDGHCGSPNHFQPTRRLFAPSLRDVLHGTPPPTPKHTCAMGAVLRCGGGVGRGEVRCRQVVQKKTTEAVTTQALHPTPPKSAQARSCHSSHDKIPSRSWRVASKCFLSGAFVDSGVRRLEPPPVKQPWTNLVCLEAKGVIEKHIYVLEL